MTLHFLVLAMALHGVDADSSIRLPRNGAVEIDTHMRDVTLRVGTGDLVTVRGGSLELDGGTLQVGDDARRNRGAGPIEVTVPAWCRVELSTLGGNFTLTGTPARLHAETVTGFIHVNGGSGIVEIESVSGPIVVTDFRGSQLSVDATNESVTITNATGVIEVDAVAGNVVLHGIRSASVTASSINGTVEFEGPLAPTGNYEFTSQNRDVTLWLPADVSARFRVSSMNGGLRTDIPATTGGQAASNVKEKNKDKDTDAEHLIVATFGSGSARVTIDVFNGNAVVKSSRK